MPHASVAFAGGSNKIYVTSLHLNNVNSREMEKFLRPLDCFWDSHRNVILDFSRCDFLNAEGAAILAAFYLGRSQWSGHTAIDQNSVSPSLWKQLLRWGLAALYGIQKTYWADNAIPLFHQKQLDHKSVEGYIRTVIRPGSNMPAMTSRLTRRANSSFCELFYNIFEHAGSFCGGFAIGQYFPKVKQVQICVCDLGIGLAAKVQSAGHFLDDPGGAIDWALAGNTTKNGPGGCGLKLLKDFVRFNGGSLRILSNNGHLVQENRIDHSALLSYSFPGTLIQFGFLIRPDEVYTIEQNEKEQRSP